MKKLRLVPLVGLLAQCTGGAPPAPPAPPSLAYQVADTLPAVYVQGDTARVQVDAGNQTVDVTVASSMTLGMRFRSAPGGGLRVVADVRDLEATTSNPLGAPESVAEASVGEVTFDLDRTGEATLVSRPEMDEAVAGYVAPETVAESFFPRLPGRAVTAGESWTDTIRVVSEEGPTSLSSTAIITYTAAGDTSVMGRSYILVRTRGSHERRVEGTQAGFDMTQELTGTSEGWFLWDPRRGLPAEILSTSIGTGTMNVSEVPFPLTMRSESTSHVRLREPAGG